MNEIIQSLEANATNGYEQFCYIDEKMLEAMKELAKRENEEKVKLEHNWNELKEYINRKCIFDNDTITYEDIMNKISELEEGGKND